MPSIGLMISATDANDVWHDYIAAFKGALPDTIIYHTRPAHGAGGSDYGAYYNAAKLLIQDGVDVIVTAGNLAAQACKDATTHQNNPTPIVVASAGDLADLAADGNLTGCTNGQNNLDILKQRITQMNQLNPAPTGVGIVGNDTVPPVAWAMHQALGWIPEILHVQAYLVPFRQPSDLQDAATIRNKLNSSLPNGVNTLYVCSDPLLRTHGHDFIAAAHGAPRLNTMHEFGDWVNVHHGDRAFGPDFTKLFITAAGFVQEYFDNGALPDVFDPDVTDCAPTF